MHAVLGRLGFRNRHKHERQLAGLGRVIIGWFDHYLAGLLEGDRPLQRPRPEPGQPGGVGGVNDEMDQTSRHRPHGRSSQRLRQAATLNSLPVPPRRGSDRCTRARRGVLDHDWAVTRLT
jgi:hypothetical protein